MSINVGRGSVTHDIALARACELKIDVLLVQEPWWSGLTKPHSFFDRHVPYGGENIRPRAVTYTKKNPKQIVAVQKFPSPTPTGDYCWIQVNGVTFLNVYKAPHDTTAVKPLLDWTPTCKSVVAGDFNSVHWAWQPCADLSYGQGEEIGKWAERNNLSCLIVGEPTHRAGNTLDLAWTNISGTCAWVDKEECMTSDHLPISGIVPHQNSRPSPSKGPSRVPKTKLPEFTQLVSRWILPSTHLNTVDEIETFATELVRTLTDALKAVGR